MRLSLLDPKECKVHVARTYEVARINTREKEIEPDGYGEATRGHELHLSELACVGPQSLVPNSSTGLGHEGLIVRR
jgi:hypothetical protein